MPSYEPFMHPGPPHPPWNDGHHHDHHHPGEPHEHAHWHPWGDVLATGECDDQLPLFSHVGRGLQGDGFDIELREPTPTETYLIGHSIDPNTGSDEVVWTTQNINGGKITCYRIPVPSGVTPPSGSNPPTPPDDHSFGYYVEYWKPETEGSDPAWSQLIGWFPDATEYANVVVDQEDSLTPSGQPAFKIHFWTANPGEDEYDDSLPHTVDYTTPAIPYDDTDSNTRTRIPVWDIVIKNDPDATWDPDAITTETEWNTPGYDHYDVQRKNTYPDYFDPSHIDGLPKPGDEGIVTLEVGPGKDIDTYTSPAMDNIIGYPDKMDDLATLPGNYSGPDSKPYAWDTVPSGWNGTPITYITNYPQGNHNPGSTNYSPNIAAYDQARFDDLHAGIEANRLAIANFVQNAVNNWVDLPFTSTWPSPDIANRSFSNRSKINVDLGLIYLDMDWELDENTTYNSFYWLANVNIAPFYTANGNIPNHSIGNLGHRIHEYGNGNIPPQYYNDFPVWVSSATFGNARLIGLACSWGFEEGVNDNRVHYVHIVGMVPIKVIDPKFGA